MILSIPGFCTRAILGEPVHLSKRPARTALFRLPCLLSSLLFALPGLAQVPKAAPIGSDLYIQIRTANVTTKDLDQIQATGFRGVRMSILWNKVEKHRGQYSYTEQEPTQAKNPESNLALTYEQLIAELNKRDLKALIVLFGGNPLYTGPLQEFHLAEMHIDRKLLRPPETEQEIDGFAKFAAYTAAHFSQEYGADKFTWLIWNEPNMEDFYPPKPNAAAFSDLMYASCKAMRKATPGLTIAGPGLAQAFHTFQPDFNFLKQMLNRNDILDCVDYITVHPYRDDEPENSGAEYEQIRAGLSKIAPGRHVTIAEDEWGYSDARQPQNIQSNRLIRAYLNNQLHGLPITNIMEWKNFVDDSTSWENNFGLVDSRGNPKAGHSAFSAFLRTMKGYKFENRMYPSKCGTEDYFLVYRNGSNRKLLAWSATGHNTGRLVTIRGSRPTQSVQLSGAVGILDFPVGASENSVSCKSSR